MADAALKLLVVDDEMIVRAILGDILSSAGYEVLAAEDGAEGWQMVQEDDNIALVISDINMPQMNGLQFMAQARSLRAELPIIILTSSNEMSVAVEAINKGADDYLLKDENIADMVLISVRKVLEMRLIARKNKQLMRDMEEQNRRLENTLAELQQTYEDLKQKKEQLIQSEKMASLGRLVAGVAHEINTPVGVCVTAASYWATDTQEISSAYQNKTMKRSDLELYFHKADELARLIQLNLSRTAELIRSFKMVSADQTNLEKRTIRVKSYLEDVLVSLGPKLKDQRFAITIDCPESLELISLPGAIAQIFTNLIMNSLIHGFEGRESGSIQIAVQERDEQVEFLYRDDGKGIAAEHIKQIFDPFFTTKRNQGGLGLGLNIIHNTVEQTLGGRITCSSQVGAGVLFTLLLPRVLGTG
ncbi:hybrid sensor histidine kinase/response regulator [Candidatus Magnetaquicoccus inordinatus]|uniref:hybrid sensor histidine kinase/response regulator n=1 Tax=Candidatus Magnetaquicoccus inordinatus TaxID=2496818 RepID=UPI00102B4DA4|nr:hybrid sensor histidine kinase/response regulator [Candidatus Magnetaquicoccus inordinatus]